MRRLRFNWFILSLVMPWIVLEGIAQPVDVTLDDLQPVARFEEAVALDVDPAGRIYVVDQGSHSVHRLAPATGEQRQFGGPGQGEGQFDFPADIDATNGLVLVVADAGNGRIQRFSREFLFLESLNVGVLERGRSGGFGGEPAYRQREETVGGFSLGRPIGVITSSNNDMYAIDEVENVVLKWDKNRNLEHVIGAYDQGAGSLVAPAALALGDDGTVFVGDRGTESILVYDPFGGYIRSMADGLCARVQSLFIQDETVLVILPDRILRYHISGMLEETIRIETDAPLVDAVVLGAALLVLTEQALLRGAWR